MRALPFILLLAGCAPSQMPYSPAREVRYSAFGQDPFWLVTIGDDKIVLTFGPDDFADARLRAHSFRRVLPRTVDGVTSWESGEGTKVIAVEARPGPCSGSRGALYEDHVRVRLSGRELHGCGGRRIEGARR